MTPTWIVQMETAIGLPLPEELRELYAAFDGEWDSDPMRLMRSAEVIEEWRIRVAQTKLRGSCPFWVSSNNDHAAIYLDGPLKGRIYLWDHVPNYPHESVAFRSVSSFLESMDDAAEQEQMWFEMQTDYYICTDYYLFGAAIPKPAYVSAITSDREVVARLRDEYAAATIEDEYDERHYALNIIGLTPAEDIESLDAFLQSKDMYIQARACEIFGNRKYELGIERLGHIARNCRGNGQSAALTALGWIGTAAALEEVLRSIPVFERGMHLHVSQVLERCGCKIEWEEDKFRKRHYHYQLPGGGTWLKIE